MKGMKNMTNFLPILAEGNGGGNNSMSMILMIVIYAAIFAGSTLHITTLPSPKSLAFLLPHSVRERIINTLQLFRHKNNIISHNFQPIYAL